MPPLTLPKKLDLSELLPKENSMSEPLVWMPLDGTIKKPRLLPLLLQPIMVLYSLLCSPLVLTSKIVLLKDKKPFKVFFVLFPELLPETQKLL